MYLLRFLPIALLAISAPGCALIGITGNSAGVRVVGKQTYCGTSSQASDAHYFATQSAFDNWVSYRDIGHWSEHVPPRGLVVVEMGQRPTGGYKLQLDNEKTGIDGDTLNIALDWQAPRLDAAVSQALTSQCVAIALPRGQYNQVQILDQLGNTRSTFKASQ